MRSFDDDDDKQTCVSVKRKTACWSVSVDLRRMTLRSSCHSFDVYDLLISTCMYMPTNTSNFTDIVLFGQQDVDTVRKSTQYSTGQIHSIGFTRSPK